MKNQAGFTLIELLIAIALVGILAAVSAPAWKPLLETSTNKAAARAIASALRDARTRAINENVEYRINFHLAADTYGLEKGNRTAGSSAWTEIKSYQSAETIDLKGTSLCNDTDFTIQFNPNGTANKIYACIMDNNGAKQFLAGVFSGTTGKVVIKRWNSATSDWN